VLLDSSVLGPRVIPFFRDIIKEIVDIMREAAEGSRSKPLVVSCDLNLKFHRYY
jgi:hypothetical protein